MGAELVLLNKAFALELGSGLEFTLVKLNFFSTPPCFPWVTSRNNIFWSGSSRSLPIEIMASLAYLFIPQRWYIFIIKTKSA